jgi:hypothetical protein
VSRAPRSRNQTYDTEVAVRQSEFIYYYLILVGKKPRSPAASAATPALKARFR